MDHYEHRIWISYEKCNYNKHFTSAKTITLKYNNVNTTKVYHDRSIGYSFMEMLMRIAETIE